MVSGSSARMRKQVKGSKSPERLIKAFLKQHFPDFS